MAARDYVPDKKYFIGVVLGALLGAGATYGYVAYNHVDKEFVPSHETCDNYFETRNGRYICVLHGQRPPEQVK